METNNVYEIAYRGVKKLEEATGAHNQLLIEDIETTEQTQDYPWTIDLQNTMFIYDKENDVRQAKVSLSRDFEDEGSLIPLMKDEVLEVTVGYKLYYSPTVIFSSYEGYATGFRWTIEETPESASMIKSAVALLLAGLSMILF